MKKYFIYALLLCSFSSSSFAAHFHIAVLPSEYEKLKLEKFSSSLLNERLQNDQTLKDRTQTVWNFSLAAVGTGALGYAAWTGGVPKILSHPSLIVTFGFVGVNGLMKGIGYLKNSRETQELFNIVETRRNRSCKHYGAKSGLIASNRLQIEEKTLGYDDFIEQRVYVNGNLLSVEDALERGLLDKKLFVFSPTIECSLKYFGKRIPIEQLMFE